MSVQVANHARLECLQRKEHAAAAQVALFIDMLHARTCCECAALECALAAGVAAAERADRTASVRAKLLARALARSVRATLDAQAASHQVRLGTYGGCACLAFTSSLGGRDLLVQAGAALAAPCFESVCACLATTVPSALPLFVQQLGTAAETGHGSHRYERVQLAQRSLQVLPAALPPSASLYTCRAAQQAAVCSHAELLCLAGKHALGMWLALHPTSPGAQTDWETAVRLLEKECLGGDGAGEALLLAVPLMFEVLAMRVCDTLAPDTADGEVSMSLPGVSEEDESEALAACVAHLFIAAKVVATAIRREALAGQQGVRAMPHSFRSWLRCPSLTLLPPAARGDRPPCRLRSSTPRPRRCSTPCTTSWSKPCTAGAPPLDPPSEGASAYIGMSSTTTMHEAHTRP